MGQSTLKCIFCIDVQDIFLTPWHNVFYTTDKIEINEKPKHPLKIVVPPWLDLSVPTTLCCLRNNLFFYYQIFRHFNSTEINIYYTIYKFFIFYQLCYSLSRNLTFLSIWWSSDYTKIVKRRIFRLWLQVSTSIF